MRRIHMPVLFFLLLLLVFLQCKPVSTMHADMILYNAHIEPIQGDGISNGAIVVVEGKIAEVGPSIEILKKYNTSQTERIDCQGQFLMPGFIEGHGHFSGLGFNLIQLDLLHTTSWQEVLDSVAARVKET